MAKEKVQVPDIGSDDPVDVVELLVAKGDSIAEEDSLLVLESAKASVEVPSPVTGKVLKLLVKAGDRVNAGDDLMEVDVQSDAASATDNKEAAQAEEPETTEETKANVDGKQESEVEQQSKPEPEAESTSAPKPPSASSADSPADDTDIHAGPAVRKLGREMGVDLHQVTQPTGNHGRITREDVHAFVAQKIQQGGVTAAAADIDFSKFGDIETVPTSRLRQTAAKHLQQNWQQVPQVTQHERVDITQLERFRREENANNPDHKLSLLAFVAKAVTVILRQFPHFNASLSADTQSLILKHYTHLGIAVDSEKGLLVPVLRNADKLGVREIANGIADLAAQARHNKLLPKDMQGASFTLSSLGSIGGTAFTPLVNAPEVAILGISRADWQPVWKDVAEGEGHFAPRLMLPLSLSYDHRVIDGADAVRFIVSLRDCLQDVRRMIL